MSKICHGSSMQSIDIDMCEKFHNDRLRNYRALVLRTSDNNNPYNNNNNNRVAPDFGSGSGTSEIRPFSQIRPNPAPAKFLAGFGRIWQTPVQLQCVQLIRIKTNEADLSSDVFAILISFTCNYRIVIIINKLLEVNLVLTVVYLFLFGLC